MERERLVTVATELNELLGLEPAINLEQENGTLIEEIKQASELLEEGDEVSPQTGETIKEIKGETGAPKEEVKTEASTDITEESSTPDEKKESSTSDSSNEGKVKRDPSKSNKGRIFSAWKNGEGEADIAKLNAMVNNAVKESTIKGWISAWKNGKNLPAIAKKR